MKLSALTARFLGNGDTSAVFRGMATLAWGSGLARVIGIVSIPILARLYTPEDFGVMAVFVALVAILAPLLTLRYVLALPLPRHDGLAMNLMALSAGLMLIVGTVIAIGLALFAEPLLTLMSMEVLAPRWWLIVLALFGSGTYEMLTLWATRRRAYKAIAHTQIAQSAAGAIVKIGFGAFGAGPIGLLVGHVVAQSGGVGTLLRQFRTEFRSNWRHVRRSRLERVAIRHRGFPTYRLPSQLLLVFSSQAPLLFAATLYHASITGQLALAMTVLAVPLSLLGGSMAKALYAEAARIGAANPERILAAAKITQNRLFLIGIGPSLMLLILGPSLFSVVFGAEWEPAGAFAAILAFYLLFQFTSAPLMQLLNIFDGQLAFLALNMVRVALMIVLFIVSMYFEFEATLFVISYSAAMSLFYVAVSVFVYKLIRAHTRRDIPARSSHC